MRQPTSAGMPPRLEVLEDRLLLSPLATVVLTQPAAAPQPAVAPAARNNEAATLPPALVESKAPLARQTVADRLPPVGPDGVKLFSPGPSGQAEIAQSQENAYDLAPAALIFPLGQPSVTPPPAGVQAGVLPADWQGLEQGSEQFVARLEHLNQDESSSLLLPHLVPWLVFVALAPLTFEVLRWRLKKPKLDPS
jgi:hypothetical protein